MEQEQRKTFQQRLVNVNWYIFGAVLFTVGMTIITSHVAWFILSVPLIWMFGVISAAVIGGNVIARRNEENDENN